MKKMVKMTMIMMKKEMRRSHKLLLLQHTLFVPSITVVVACILAMIWSCISSKFDRHLQMKEVSLPWICMEELHQNVP